MSTTPMFTEPFPSTFTPTLPLLGLSESEKQMIATLQTRAQVQRAQMQLSRAYYRGEQIIENLRIAVPAELEFLRTIVGWASMAVDPYVERLQTDCFRRAGSTDGDDYLAGIMDENKFASEQLLAFKDSLTMGPAYWMVGSATESGGVPVITVESPLNMTALWDLRGTTARAGLLEYRAEDGTRRGAFVMPKQTIHLGTNDKGQWVIADRDQHDFDFCPIVRMANQPETSNRGGESAITAAIRSHVAAACRTLLGIEVARELYSVPQLLLLGVTESAFQNSDGSPKSAWDTYITQVLALERDDEGQLPDVKQKATYDPATFTRLLDWHASAVAGLLAATPQDLGLYTDGNPASADSVIAMESRRDRRAKNMWPMFGDSLVDVAKMAIRFDNKGVLPPDYRRLSLDWYPVTMASPVSTADALSKEISAGMVPPTSDVVLKRAGYNAADRARLAQDRRLEDGRQVARQLAESVTTTTTTPPTENAPANGPAGV